jgi:hypothetical protein
MDRLPPDPPQLIRECPDCGAGDVRATLDTFAGAYCQCESCGHLWHDERLKPGDDAVQRSRRSPDSFA